MTHTPGNYLLAGQTTEFERLRLQSLVWEPAGRALLAELPLPADARALDVGCGMLGWPISTGRYLGAHPAVGGASSAIPLLTKRATLGAFRIG